jgi:hypothetical protein
MARSVGPSVGNKPRPPLARRGRDKGIGCPARVFHPGPELSAPPRGRRYECSLTVPSQRLQAGQGSSRPSFAEGTPEPCRGSSGFQVGRHQRGDDEPYRNDSPSTPSQPPSSLPGGHATSVDSGRRPRAETGLAVANVVRPPPEDPRAPSGGRFPVGVCYDQALLDQGHGIPRFSQGAAPS